MKHTYDLAYDPPIPVLQIRLFTPEWSLYTPLLSAIVDTGADATLVPLPYLHEIEASVEGQSGLRSQWGERRIVNLYLVDLEVEEITLPSVWVVGDDRSEEVVLGRNVINRLKILLDGPAATSELINPSTRKYL